MITGHEEYPNAQGTGQELHLGISMVTDIVFDMVSGKDNGESGFSLILPKIGRVSGNDGKKCMESWMTISSGRRMTVP